jgi:hypothetical protein
MLLRGAAVHRHIIYIQRRLEPLFLIILPVVFLWGYMLGPSGFACQAIPSFRMAFPQFAQKAPLSTTRSLMELASDENLDSVILILRSVGRYLHWRSVAAQGPVSRSLADYRGRQIRFTLREETW